MIFMYLYFCLLIALIKVFSKFWIKHFFLLTLLSQFQQFIHANIFAILTG